MDLFFSNLFVQSLQVLALNFGLGLLQTAGGGSAGFLQFISGAATLLLAFRIPALTAAGVGGGATSFLSLVALFRGLQTMGQPGSSANLGLLPGPDSGASTGPLAAIIPADQLAVTEQVAAATPCAIPWSVLAGGAS